MFSYLQAWFLGVFAAILDARDDTPRATYRKQLYAKALQAHKLRTRISPPLSVGRPEPFGPPRPLQTQISATLESPVGPIFTRRNQ